MIINNIEKNNKGILKAEGVVRTYHANSPKPVHAIKGVDLELKQGEFVALMGRSGSGKSTLLHQLALLDTPNAGKIWIKNKRVSEMTEKEKAMFRLNHIGYIFQDYALSPELTLFENVALPMMALGVNKTEYKNAVNDVLDKLGLLDSSTHLPSELSGGQQQRASIARAIVNKPSILFADEPTANLDSESSKDVLNAMKELKEKYGQTILMVTHEPDDVAYVDRTITLKDGEILNGTRKFNT